MTFDLILNQHSPVVQDPTCSHPCGGSHTSLQKTLPFSGSGPLTMFTARDFPQAYTDLINTFPTGIPREKTEILVSEETKEMWLHEVPRGLKVGRGLVFP